MSKLSIGYFADGPWSHKAFEKIIKDNSLQIKFIVPRIGTKDNTLRSYANQHNINYLSDSKINSIGFINKAKEYNCDLFVSMSFNQIFKNEFINLPPLKAINCHAGNLPFYRGRNILNWVLINDEKEFGITVHYIDEGIDTGDIILRRTYPIDDNDNYSSLLKIAYIECAEILYDAIKLIQNKSVSIIKQKTIHPVGLYCTQRKQGDEIIDWNWSSRMIFNFVRALNQPDGPGARSYLDSDAEVIINKAEEIENAPTYYGIRGAVLVKEGDNLMVKTGDSLIKITDYYSPVKINVGQRFK